MARIKGIVEFYEAGNLASITPPLPDHASGDGLLVFAVKDDVAGTGPTTASSGWTVGGSSASAGTTTSACRAGWFYKVAASSQESITITSSDSDSWTVTSIAIEGVHSSMIDNSNGNGVAVNTNPAGPYQAASITVNNANSLVFYAMLNSGSAQSPFPGARTISSHDSANEGLGIAMKVQLSTGASGTYNFFPDDHDAAANNSVSFTVSIRDSGSLDYQPAYLNTNHVELITPFRGSVNTLRGETWATAVTNIPVLGEVENKAVYQYDDSTATFYDVTTAANNSTVSDWQLLNNSPAPAANDYTAFCLDQPHVGFRVLYTTAAVGGTRVWEVYNGSTWVTLTVTDASTSFTLTAGTVYNITMTAAQQRTISGIWKSTTLNGTTGYWLRCRWSTAPTTNPTMTYMRPMYGYTLYDAVASVADAGGNPYHNASSFTPAAPVQGEWGGTYLTIGTDVTPITPANKFIIGTWQYNTPRDYIDTSRRSELGGIAINFADSSYNERTYIIGGYKAADTSQDDRNIFVLQWSSTTKTYPTPLVSDPTTIANVGVWGRQLRGTGSQQFNQLVAITTPIINGGTSTNPITNDEFFNTFNIEYYYPIPYFRNGVLSIPVQIGGGDAVHLVMNLAQIKFPRRTTEPDPFVVTPYCSYHIDEGALGLVFDARSGDTCKLTNSVLSGDTRWKFEFLATASSGATWDFRGTSVINAVVTLRNVYTFTSMNFVGCGLITTNSAPITDSTISNSTEGNGAILFPSAAAGDAVDRITFLDNNDGDLGHSIRITASGTYTFDGHTFSGGGPAARSFHTTTGVDAGTDIVTVDAAHGYSDGDAIYYQDQGGAQNMGLTDGTLYYVNSQTSTTLSFHATQADAVADTNKIALTSAGGETHYIYSAKADVYNASGGAVTINITNGGSTPTIRNSDGSSTTIQNAVSIQITVINNSGTPIENAQVWIQKESDDANVGHPGNPFTSTSGNNQGDSDFVVNETPPADLPSSGWIKIKGAGSEQAYRYASRSSSTFTFNAEVTGTDNGTGTSTVLNETNIGSKDIVEGDTIRNTTASPDQWAIVLSVSTNSITTTPLSDGGSWNGASYSVHRLAVNYKSGDTATVPLMNEQTNVSGVATESYNYISDKDILVRIRLASGSPDYLPYSTTGTITSSGYTLTATLAEDNISN